MATKFLDYIGLSYFWGKIKAWCNATFVHLTTDENITGTKTFVGSKKIAFKQSGTNDKLGFTLYNNSNKEQGYLEYNPTNKIANVPLFTLGNYATAADELTYIGFRRYSNISGASGAYNLLAPLISDAKTPFNLTTTYTNFYLPLGISDGTNIVTASNSGVVDISSLLSGFLTSASTLDATKLSGTIPSGCYTNTTYTAGSGLTLTGTEFSLDSHNQASNTINLMTGYSKPNSGSAIAITDTLNDAIGKLEAKVDAVDQSNVVHRTGDETVDGTKTFIGSISSSASAAPGTGVFFRDTDLVRGTPPSINHYLGIPFLDASSAIWDSNGTHGRFGIIEQRVSPNGDTSLYMCTYKNEVGATESATITVGFESGAAFARTVSTPTTNTSNLDIITRGFLKDYGFKTSLKTFVGVCEGEARTDCYYKILEGEIVGVYNHHDYMILIQNVVASNHYGFWHIHLYTGSTAGVYAGGHSTLLGDQDLPTGCFHCVYKSNSGGTLKYELYVYLPYRYTGYRFTLLGEAQRSSKTYFDLSTIYNKDTSGGVTALPSGYTALTTVFSVLGNPIDWSNINNKPTIPTIPNLSKTDSGSGNAVTAISVSGHAITVTKGSTFLTSHQSLSNYVTLNGAQTISASKTFSATQIFSAESPCFKMSANNKAFRVWGGNGDLTGAVVSFAGGSHSSIPGYVRLYAATSSSSYKLFELRPNGSIYWAGSSIHSSSDERLKTPIQNINDNILNAWEQVQWGEFKFLESIKEKGFDNARKHVGLIAQAVVKVFEDNNLNILDYGICCHEVHEAVEGEPAEDMWAVRYIEALCMEAAYQRRKNKILENRISELEKQVSDMLQILQSLKGAN